MYFALVFLGVFVFMAGLLLLKYAQVSPLNFTAENIETNVLNQENTATASGWINKVAQFKASRDVLPVNFIHIEINDNYPKPIPPAPKINYEVIVAKCTDYSLFCMRRLARSMDIDLSVAKIGDVHKIIIAAPSAAAANSFVTELKQYNINSKIKALK